MNYVRTIASAALVLLLSAYAAEAQQASSTPASAQLEEITVTAQRRSENMQDVPIAVRSVPRLRWLNNVPWVAVSSMTIATLCLFASALIVVVSNYAIIDWDLQPHVVLGFLSFIAPASLVFSLSSGVAITWYVSQSRRIASDFLGVSEVLETSCPIPLSRLTRRLPSSGGMLLIEEPKRTVFIPYGATVRWEVVLFPCFDMASRT